LGQWVAAVGEWTLRWFEGTLAFAAFGATALSAALRRESWRTPVRAAFWRALHRVAAQSAATTVVTGALLGFALVTQILYWLQSAGQTQLVGAIVVRLLVRELVPIIVGLIIFGRVGTGVLIELGEARPKGWLRQLERQGIDPVALTVMPRLVAFAIGAFCLGTLLLVSTLASGYLVGSAFGLVTVSVWQFAENVLRAMAVGDFIVPPAKCLSIGFAVALVCCATALSRRDEAEELQRLLQRGFVRAALAILLVNGVFDLAG
jgi:phospholipid/cholesterol/gamma-HCH transport system permease protein